MPLTIYGEGPSKKIFSQKYNSLIAGLTVTQVYHQTGLDGATLECAKNGNQFPSADDALIISRAFGCSLQWLIDDAIPVSPVIPWP